MLNIGPGELIMICVIALIVLGPEKLPQAMRTVGRVTTELRRISSGFQSELEHAFEDDSLEDRRRRERAAAGTGDTPADTARTGSLQDGAGGTEAAGGPPADGTPEDGAPADGPPADGTSEEGSSADGPPEEGSSADDPPGGSVPASRW